MAKRYFQTKSFTLHLRDFAVALLCIRHPLRLSSQSDTLQVYEGHVMSQQVWDALVLGGGDPGDEFAAAHQVRVKSMIPVAGKPMGQWVLEALRQSGAVGRVAYVGPLSADMATLVDLQVTDRGSLIANLEAGVAALQECRPAESHTTSPRVLVSTADIPMLSAQMVRDVLANAPEAGVVYPVVCKEVCEATYPGVKRTYARLQDGTFTGGNLFMVDPALIGEFIPRLRALLAARKAPLRLAALIGPGILLRLVTGRLRVAQLEHKVSDLLGVKARALITPHAAVGTDVDKESDLLLAQRVLIGKDNQ